VNSKRGNPDTWKRNEVSVIPAIKERSEIKEVCPPELHEGGKELQEGNISATSMTALLNAKVQTYTTWTLVPKRNGDGGTYKAANGPKAPNYSNLHGNCVTGQLNVDNRKPSFIIILFPTIIIMISPTPRTILLLLLLQLQ
jgi:hypothetical protein